MNRNTNIPVAVVTGLLLLYIILLVTGGSPPLTGIIFFLSPFFVIWMAYRVIRYDTYHGKELEENEEWGYTDKNKDELKIF
jgi:uncharacterized membrane protein YjgN (DUF898 family)